jgi:hypothetical protein
VADAIGDFAFYNTKITSIKLPKYLTKIGASAFEGCSDLRIENKLLDSFFPTGLKTIGSRAFYDLEVNLTNEVIEFNSFDTVDDRDSTSTENGTGRTGVTLNVEELIEVGDYAFFNSDTSKSFLGTNGTYDFKKIKKIGKHAFEGNFGLRGELKFSSTVLESIDDSAFANCSFGDKVNNQLKIEFATTANQSDIVENFNDLFGIDSHPSTKDHYKRNFVGDKAFYGNRFGSVSLKNIYEIGSSAFAAIDPNKIKDDTKSKKNYKFTATIDSNTIQIIGNQAFSDVNIDKINFFPACAGASTKPTNLKYFGANVFSC